MSYRIKRFRERLDYLNEWLIDTIEYEEHRSLSLKATLEVYEDQPVISFLYKIYLLPTLIITSLSKFKNRYFIKKCIKEMELIKHTIDVQEKQKIKYLEKFDNENKKN